MNYLAIDVAQAYLTVAVKKGEERFVEHNPDNGVRHSVTLLPTVESVLSRAGLSLSDLDFIACTVGAGSFTGIRIGVATVKALCFSLKIPCLAVTSFDSISYNKACGKILAVINAKHGSYYACGYSDGKVCLPPEFISGERLLELQKEYKVLTYERIDGVQSEVVSPVDGLFLAVERKAEEKTFDLEKLTPLYVRKSQAEEGR